MFHSIQIGRYQAVHRHLPQSRKAATATAAAGAAATTTEKTLVTTQGKATPVSTTAMAPAWPVRYRRCGTHEPRSAGFRAGTVALGASHQLRGGIRLRKDPASQVCKWKVKNPLRYFCLVKISFSKFPWLQGFVCWFIGYSSIISKGVCSL